MFIRIIIGGSTGTGRVSYITKLISDLVLVSSAQYYNILIIRAEVLTNNGVIPLAIYYNKDGIFGDMFTEDFYKSADGALIFYDPSVEVTFTRALEEIKYIKNLNSGIPIILCRNRNNFIPPQTDDSTLPVPLYKVFVKLDYNIVEPLQDLIQRICGKNIIICRSPIPEKLFPLSLFAEV